MDILQLLGQTTSPQVYPWVPVVVPIATLIIGFVLSFIQKPISLRQEEGFKKKQKAKEDKANINSVDANIQRVTETPEDQVLGQTFMIINPFWIVGQKHFTLQLRTGASVKIFPRTDTWNWNGGEFISIETEEAWLKVWIRTARENRDWVIFGETYDEEDGVVFRVAGTRASTPEERHLFVEPRGGTSP